MIILTDNNNGKQSAHKAVIRGYGEANAQEHLTNLNELGNLTLAELSQSENLLTFPLNLGDSKDLKDKQSEPIFRFESIKCDNDGDIIDATIRTSNIMGFFGYKGTQVAILSRFASNSTQRDSTADSAPKPDFFLHYMLGKIAHLNFFKNFPHSASDNAAFDLLPYLLPNALREALRQGLFRAYVRRRYDDANVRGTIDIARHISRHIPFDGAVSYATREHSHDNALTQLIRHTIEYVSTKPLGRVILQSMLDEVAQIRLATPLYDKASCRAILSQNLHLLRHPYYDKYEPLRRLCVQILRHERLGYGRDDERVSGVLFDGAYLWEEYLWSVLESAKLGFKHPRNKSSKGAIDLLDSMLDSNKWAVYPDFYIENKAVLDAKYKRLEGGDSIDSGDKHQIISYIYTLGAKMGGFVYPLSADSSECESEIGSVKNAAILKSAVYKFALKIPQNAESLKDFADKIQKSENCLKQILLKFLT